MRVIIPAAGVGTRLYPLTLFSPKCMVDINGKPLISFLLSSLKSLNVSEVVIVTGHKGAMIEEYVKNNPEFPLVHCIHNTRYETTNSIVSISLTTHLWNEDFCIIDSDLIVKPSLLQKVISAQETCLFIDNSKPPELIDMKAQVIDKRLIHMDKSMLKRDTFGEFFGLSRWTPEFAKGFKESIESFLSRGETGVWYEFPIREMAKHHFLPVRTCSSDMWHEVDTIGDYERAATFVEG